MFRKRPYSAAATGTRAGGDDMVLTSFAHECRFIPSTSSRMLVAIHIIASEGESVESDMLVYEFKTTPWIVPLVYGFIQWETKLAHCCGLALVAVGDIVKSCRARVGAL